jgi:hypothetical protein
MGSYILFFNFRYVHRREGFWRHWSLCWNRSIEYNAFVLSTALTLFLLVFHVEYLDWLPLLSLRRDCR